MEAIKVSNEGIEIILEAVELGQDLNISIYGGDKPHIGAIALAIPRPSLENSNIVSASVSVLTITGHKEDELAKATAKKISSSLNKVTVVSCGIHINQISPKQLIIISTLVDECVEIIINQLKNR